MQLRNCRQDVYASTWQAAPHAAPTADSTPDRCRGIVSTRAVLECASRPARDDRDDRDRPHACAERPCSLRERAAASG